MRPAYKTFYWLDTRWSTPALLKLTDADIKERTKSIAQLNIDNQRLFNNAKLRRADEQHEFKRKHPRSDFIQYRIERPPDLLGMWDRLLRRRQRAIQSIEKAQAQKRTTFMGRMTEGKIRAMHRREQEIRRMIREQAEALGIEITERATDKQLAQLFAGFRTAEDALSGGQSDGTA